MEVGAEEFVGCSHYKRKSKFVSPCCNKVYICRICHDENECHAINRKEISVLICGRCETRQQVQAECEKCSVRFGKYACLECRLFDDEERNQYHCDGCGICRIGGRDRFFHCKTCNMCLPVKLKNNHRCVENVSHSNCPVCLDNLHNSRIPCHIPDCGHLLHKTCFDELLQAGHYVCPTCQTSVLDMTQLWEFLDKEIEMTPMPPEYQNYKADILCKDCHSESVVKFHVVGLKCGSCGSYNTCRIKGSPKPDMREQSNTIDSAGPSNVGDGSHSSAVDEIGSNNGDRTGSSTYNGTASNINDGAASSTNDETAANIDHSSSSGTSSAVGSSTNDETGPSTSDGTDQGSANSQ